MEELIYFFVFAIGTVFGSFFTLAVYRIPIKQSILYGRSYCPKCNHRLEFFDLIPVLSYVFLGGKCRYCKSKIRPRYLLLEILSGLTFLLFALSIKINLYNLEVSKLVYLLFGMLYLSIIFIIAGIDKENKSISKPVLIFGFIFEAIYIVYLYILGLSIYKYAICMCLAIILMLINCIVKKKTKKNNYIIGILLLILFTFIFTKQKVTILTIITTIIVATGRKIVILLKDPEKNNSEVMPIGFYLCVCNILLLILQNFFLS